MIFDLRPSLNEPLSQFSISNQEVTVFTPADSPKTHAVVTGREDGLPRVWVLEIDIDEADGDDVVGAGCNLAVASMVRLDFPESACDTGIGPNRDATLPYVALSYDSLVTPPSTIAVELSDTSARRVLKTKHVPGYDPADFACDRACVRSRDGEADIPVSLVYRRDALGGDEGAPTHLLGYGSYGASIECSFRSTRLPLLNRGVVYAIAHVRGTLICSVPPPLFLQNESFAPGFLNFLYLLVTFTALEHRCVIDIHPQAEGSSVGPGTSRPNTLQKRERSRTLSTSPRGSSGGEGTAPAGASRTRRGFLARVGARAASSSGRP